MARAVVLLLTTLLALAVVAAGYNCRNRDNDCPNCVRDHTPGTFKKLVLDSKTTKCMFVASLVEPGKGECIEFSQANLDDALKQRNAVDLIKASSHLEKYGITLPGEQHTAKCNGVHHCATFADDCQLCVRAHIEAHGGNHAGDHRCFFVAPMNARSKGHCKLHSPNAVEQAKIDLGISEENDKRIILPDAVEDEQACPWGA